MTMDNLKKLHKKLLGKGTGTDETDKHQPPTRILAQPSVQQTETAWPQGKLPAIQTLRSASSDRAACPCRSMHHKQLSALAPKGWRSHHLHHQQQLRRHWHSKQPNMTGKLSGSAPWPPDTCGDKASISWPRAIQCQHPQEAARSCATRRPSWWAHAPPVPARSRKAWSFCSAKGPPCAHCLPKSWRSCVPQEAASIRLTTWVLRHLSRVLESTSSQEETSPFIGHKKSWYLILIRGRMVWSQSHP